MQRKRYLFFIEQDYAFAILRPLQAKILERGDEVAWFLCHISDSYLNLDERHLKNVAEVQEYNADANIVPGNIVPPYFPGIKVCVFHGLCIEKKGHFRIRGWFDLYCTHGELTTQKFKTLEQKHQNFSVVETGWPKLDCLIHLIDSGEQIEEPISILYAPTFSPSLSSPPHLFDEIKKLVSSGNYKVSVKFHPLEDDKIIKKYLELCEYGLIFTDDKNFVAVAAASDIVISDTSSTIAEAIYLGKPVITFNTLSPCPRTKNFTEADTLEKEILWVLENYTQQKEQGFRYINKMHPYRDGESSTRVIEAVESMLLGEIKPAKKRPFQLIRRWKMRRVMAEYL